MPEHNVNYERPGWPHGGAYRRVSSEGQKHPRDAGSALSSDSAEDMTELESQAECLSRYAAEVGLEAARTYIETAETVPEPPDAA